MKLHEDIDAFKFLINDIHEKTGYRLDVLEKDYYVVLILKELAKKQEEGLPAYFKGGTALYKALHTTNRFSEDIDLSVDTRGCSRTQNEKRLEQATSFTISEPVANMEVSTMLYELATEEQKKILRDMYDVKPFQVQTITIERIFVDKLFAAEAYVRKAKMKSRAFEAAKHIYDLVVMAKVPRIIELLNNERALGKLLEIRMKEEMSRLDGIPQITPSEFTFFDDVKSNKLVISAYETMQRQYVLREGDRISCNEAFDKLDNIRNMLENNVAWNTTTV